MKNSNLFKEQQLSDAELAEQMLNKKPQTEMSKLEELDNRKKQMEDWYSHEFLPYKKAREQQKKDFQSFKTTVHNHPQEIKYMIASLLEEKHQEAVTTWNYLKLDPKIKDIRLDEENLVITDLEDDDHEMHFDSLLDQIDMILGG